MNKNDIGVDAIRETCTALSDGDVEKGKEIIRTKYPHQKPLKQRKSFTKKEQLKFPTPKTPYKCRHNKGQNT